MSEDKLCLEGDRAKPFMKCRVGDRMPLKLDAVVVSVGMRPDYSDIDPKAGKSRPQKAYVEFVLRSVNGKEEKAEDYSSMSSEDFEKKVAKNKGYAGNG